MLSIFGVMNMLVPKIKNDTGKGEGGLRDGHISEDETSMPDPV
jgi:hypothetical protein